MESVDFTEDQQHIMNASMEGKNIFLTGPGGCGKSFIVKHIVKHAKENNKRIQVCATTGCASILLNCGAKTIHSWSGIGVGNMDDNAITTKIMMNTNKRKNWRNTDILVIDEISMMSKRMFELLNHIGQRVRKDGRPFGGIQLICSGDFFQLPPVGKSSDPDSTSFCFESELWHDVFHEQILLDKLFRQKDETYVRVLHQIREGYLDKKSYDILKNRVIGECNMEKSIEKYAVYLLPTKQQAFTMNRKNMDKIQEPEIKFKSEEITEAAASSVSTQALPLSTNKKKPSVQQIKTELSIMYKGALFENELTLKKGCKVMCIVNLDMEEEIVNGSVGEIIGFNTGSEKQEPIVRFQNGITKTIYYHSWNSESIPGVCIKQIPLILAWGITIHKAQGATLDTAVIDLGRNVFESGQSYVALSRVKSLSGLYLTSFDATKIKANPKVKSFYELFYE